MIFLFLYGVDSPGVVFSAVDLAVSREAREVAVQRLLALRAAQTVDVPLLVGHHQEVPVADETSASGAHARLSAVDVTAAA